MSRLARVRPCGEEGTKRLLDAMIFDLDGTLVQTEKLKAISYARAAAELRPGIEQRDVVEAFARVVGRARREVALFLLERFDLREAAAARQDELGVGAPWQAFVQIRLRIYERMLADPEVLREHRWPHTLELVREARAAHCRLGLATMSHCPEVRRVLAALDLADTFDFVATRDDVERAKPDPEIYALVANELGAAPARCLVIEDSPAGVAAATAAGMAVVAVTTPFTRAAFRDGSLLDRRWVVDEPAMLPEVVRRRIEAMNEKKGG